MFLFQTTLPMFRSKTFTVRRRYSDFLGLYEKLSEKHGPNGYIVPPPPEKSLRGKRFLNEVEEMNLNCQHMATKGCCPVQV